MTSVAYIGRKSRTERLKKTKIGTEVVHVTRDWDTTFKVKRSKVKVTRPLCSPPCWRVRRLRRLAWHGNVLAVGNCCYIAVRSGAKSASAFGAHGGGERSGAYGGGRPPTGCLHLCLCLRNIMHLRQIGPLSNYPVPVLVGYVFRNPVLSGSSRISKTGIPYIPNFLQGPGVALFTF